MAEREPAPRPRELVSYKVYATADLNAPGAGGVHSLAPPSGFVDAGSGPHLFKIRCLFCGDETTKDVLVFALAPGAKACTDTFPPRALTKRCHPKCPNPAHMVRKCSDADCRQLGSIEAIEVTESLTEAGRTHFLTVKALGYQVISYRAGQEWEATSAAGVVPVTYSKGFFRGWDAAGAPITIRTVFDVEMEE